MVPLVAILLIYLIMVAQFQRFISPAIVLFTVPLAFTGGLLASLPGMDQSMVYDAWASLVLSGVVVNSRHRVYGLREPDAHGGMEKREALIEPAAGPAPDPDDGADLSSWACPPWCWGLGMGAEIIQPVAVVCIGGLTYATLMTLFVVPVLYDLITGRR